MEFGIFDHLDRGSVPLREFYESRLKLAEAYDRAGFRGYHIAEHHATPLGMAPAPGAFLSAVAQRTERLRFGPLVYILPLYHPLRLVEEICMLDQMSGGRLELGIGRGISPVETGYYGVDPAKAEKMYAEALSIVLMGLSAKSVDFAGEFYRFKDVPVELEPVQKPHPPLWYGVVFPDSAARAARNGYNIVSNLPAPEMRRVVDRFVSCWRDAHGSRPLPRIGMTRYLVLADSDAEAREVASRAYKLWYASFVHLWIKHGLKPIGVGYPEEFEGFDADGRGLAGTPATVRRALERQIEEAGINYLLCRFAFGDLTLRESMRSLELFVRGVMPALSEQVRTATPSPANAGEGWGGG